MASLQYSRVNVDAYTENGAGEINLKVDAQGYDLLESGLGMKLERAFATSHGSYVPEAHIKWLHKLVNPSIKQVGVYAATGSTSFTTSKLEIADDSYNVGAGLTFLSCNCNAKVWSVEGVYDYDWTNSGFSAHQVMAKITRRF